MDIQTSIVKVQDGEVTFKSTQDFTPYAEHAKRLHNEGQHGSSEMRHAASFPPMAVQLYCETNGIDFHEFCSNEVHVKRMLSDPALADFRIWKGRVG